MAGILGVVGVTFGAAAGAALVRDGDGIAFAASSNLHFCAGIGGQFTSG